MNFTITVVANGISDVFEIEAATEGAACRTAVESFKLFNDAGSWEPVITNIQPIKNHRS